MKKLRSTFSIGEHFYAGSQLSFLILFQQQKFRPSAGRIPFDFIRRSLPKDLNAEKIEICSLKMNSSNCIMLRLQLFYINAAAASNHRCYRTRTMKDIRAYCKNACCWQQGLNSKFASWVAPYYLSSVFTVSGLTLRDRVSQWLIFKQEFDRVLI